MTLLDEPQTPASNITEYSVTELSGVLKRTIEDRFGLVRVRGEISGFRGRHSSGHCYFSLKDERARLEAVIWKATYAKLAFKPEEGLEVVATGRLTTYPGSSKYQIVIEEIAPAGAGALMALLNERRMKLEAEGLFAAERKKKLPFLPRVIGVVTSPTGAVIRDIRHRIADRFPVHLVVWPVRVQGETSGEEVARAIAGFDAIEAGGPIPRPDVIIVARGGGSLEDLWGFNDEAVVRAVAACSIPLISAIGHETDWTLIDHVADMRAPTPTGAAEIAVPVKAEISAALAGLHARQDGAAFRLMEHERRAVAGLARALPSPDMLLALPRRRLDEAASGLSRSLRLGLSDKRRLFGEAGARLSVTSLEHSVQQKRAELRHADACILHGLQSSVGLRRQRFDRVASLLRPQAIAAKGDEKRARFDVFAQRFEAALAHSMEARRGALTTAGRMVESLSPMRVLSRGYAIIRDTDNNPVTRAADLLPGMSFEVEFAAGERRRAVAEEDGAPPRPRPAPRRRAAKAAEDQGSLF
ncbi:exodeoxyribonuclease VII large subunit [Consotaella salsifontis]|uniref:Exodeoxyribonuclease 7 large subunit n=1 Tax=Consotaella salsifontis TaxID=1365950 RepID=A0A1T4Q091_9HYPH|nr:exodeoxyribonuclease VII large subunit [Consotaella salsifontis]SJZ97183.1 Exodeoxyribonuclease VII large subunit [Consotaella salsifontis]